jgi:hypothetical protein
MQRFMEGAMPLEEAKRWLVASKTEIREWFGGSGDSGGTPKVH